MINSVDGKFNWDKWRQAARFGYHRALWDGLEYGFVVRIVFHFRERRQLWVHPIAILPASAEVGDRAGKLFPALSDVLKPDAPK